MAFLFGDSFHHLSQADLNKKWANSPNGSIGTSGARFPGSKYFSPASSPEPLQASSLGSKSTLIVGFAFLVPGLFSPDLNVCSLRDSGGEQLSLRLTGGGLLLYVSRAGTTLATAATPLNAGSWNYIEFKATIHNTSGAYAVRVNGAPVAGISDATNVNTRGTGTNNSANQVWFHDSHFRPIAFRYSDVYILDDTGSAPLNNFLGDVRYDVLYPDGAGAYSQWTPTSGDNYTNVDESPANQTDYVESTADDQIDSYSFADMSVAASTIYVVQVNAYAQKTDAGAKSLAIFCKASDGTESVSADQALGSSWLVYRRILPGEPYSGGTRPWTVARVNGSQFGVKSRP
jgi:hypothetical protein